MLSNSLTSTVIQVEIVAWDSSFLGIKVGRIVQNSLKRDQLNNVLARFWASGGQLVYWPSDPFDVESQNAAIANGGSMVDMKTTYLINLDMHFVPHCQAEAYCGPSDQPKLESLAFQAGEYSRFKLDQQMPKDAYERLYRVWMQKSLSGDLADGVLVRRDRDRILGVITMKAKVEFGTIGLVAVDHQIRGRGVGRDLLLSSFAWFKEHGCRQVRVVTQGSNRAACSLYESIGFAVEKKVAFYHFWERHL